MSHKGSINATNDFTLGATKTSLQMLQQVASTIPVPGMSAAVGSALQVITIIEAIKTNRDDREALIKRITELMLVIVIPLKRSNPKTFPKDLADNTGRLSSNLEEIMDDLRALQATNRIQKILNYTSISGKIKACSAKLDWAVRHFQVQAAISDAISLFKLLDFAVCSMLNLVAGADDFDLLKRDALIETMPRVKSASHLSGRPGAPTPCFKGTREEILKIIVKWATNPDKDVPGIFWLTGVAGIGKSTIAQSIALVAYEECYLGASYFFSRRGEADLSDPRKFFPTLAYDLAGFDLEFAKHLGDALGGRTDVCYHNYQEQACKLLIEPLRLISKRDHPVLLVIDALDECQMDGIRAIIPLLIASQTQPRFPVRILFTGRPEPHLLAVFDSSIKHQQLILHNVELGLVQNDIRLYLKAGLCAITVTLSLNSGDQWFTEDELDCLVVNSKGLFVYSYTALCFIGDPRVRQPRRQLSTLLANQSQGDNPYSILDKLYAEIITSALHCDSSQYVTERFQNVVGSLVFRRDALSITATDALLGEEGTESYVRGALGDLGSVIVVPRNDDGSPQIYHESFRDYITTPSRCPSTALISAGNGETHLARRCFIIMESLMRKSVVIRTETLGRGVPPLLPNHLTYACRFWASHLSSAPLGEASLVQMLDDFVSLRILWWLEVMSYTHIIPSTVKGLTDAKKWAANSNCSETLLGLLHDAYRFTCAFLEPLSVAPIHLHTSAIPFCPRKTAFWKTYCSSADTLIRLNTENQDEWSACISTFYGHTSSVLDIAFSPNGELLASFSADNTVRMWDVTSGAAVVVLQGHTHAVQAIAFSPDGLRLTSGSDDETVRVWDIVSGASISTIQVHAQGVGAIAFSPDGSRLATRSKDKTDSKIRIWDIASGISMALQGHTKYVNTLTFSPDGSRLASVSDDKTVRVWDVVSGSSSVIMRGHTKEVRIASFSPDGALLASGSSDHTVRIWDVVSGASRAILKGHRQQPNVLAFSPDGLLLAGGFDEGTVQTWDAASGASLFTMLGHTQDVYSLAFSHDGAQLASASVDDTVRIWRVSSGVLTTTLQGHTEFIHAISFSPDGSRMASGSGDRTIRIWDITSMSKLPEDTETNLIVALSPDGIYLALGSREPGIELREVASGRCMTTLHGHTRAIRAIAFSPNSTRLASGASDYLVRIRDVPSRALMVTLNLAGHTFDIGDPAPGHNVNNLYNVWHPRPLVVDASIKPRLFARSCDVDAIVFSPDGSRLASESNDGTVVIWDVISGAWISSIFGDEWTPSTISFSPDSSRIAYGSHGPAVQIWDVVSGELMATLEHHTSRVNMFAFSPGGLWLASGSDDRTVQIWDMSSEMSIKIPHAEPVTNLAFTQDGMTLWVASQHKTSIHSAFTGFVCVEDELTGGSPDSSQCPSNWPTNNSSRRPKSISPVYYKDYWLRSRKDNHLVCHVPAEYPITEHMLCHGNDVVFLCANGRLLILHLSELICDY